MQSFIRPGPIAFALLIVMMPLGWGGCGVTVGNSVLPCRPEGEFETVDGFEVSSDYSGSAWSFVTDRSGNLFASGFGHAPDNTQQLVIRRSNDRGETWSAVQEYQLEPGKTAGGQTGLAAGKLGEVYSASSALDSKDKPYYLIHRTADGGNTWEEVDRYFPDEGSQARARAVMVHSSGRVFSGGSTNLPDNSSPWFIRMSDTGNASNWSDSDTFSLATNGISMVYDFAEDPSGRIYAAGAVHADAKKHWFVRRSSDRGESWQTVDNFQIEAGNDAVATSIAIDSSGKIYVSGHAASGSGKRWIVRSSTTGESESWETIDNYQETENQDAEARSIHIDASDRIWVAGGADSSAGISQFIVKMSADGENWRTMDKYFLDANQNAYANAIGTDLVGNIYAAGGATDSQPRRHWTVRRMVCIPVAAD